MTMITLGAGVDRSTWIMVRMPGMCPSLTGIKNDGKEMVYRDRRARFLPSIYLMNKMYLQQPFFKLFSAIFKG